MSELVVIAADINQISAILLQKTDQLPAVSPEVHAVSMEHTMRFGV